MVLDPFQKGYSSLFSANVAFHGKSDMSLLNVLSIVHYLSMASSELFRARIQFLFRWSAFPKHNVYFFLDVFI